MSFNSAFLRIPMYMLNDMKRIDEFSGVPAEKVHLLREHYTPDEVHSLLEALRYAEIHPEFDFRALMPDLRFTNAEIHRFLCKVLHSIDRPANASS